MSFPFRDHSAGTLEPVVAIALWPSHFDSKAQRSPVGGLPSVASIGGTGFPVAGLICPLCAGLSCFAAVYFEVETLSI